MGEKSQPLGTSRRQFLLSLGACLTLKSALVFLPTKDRGTKMTEGPSNRANCLTLSLCGDVMTGRGIDQVLPHPSDPLLHEPYLTDAREYVELAERDNGPIQFPVAFSYIWGEALEQWERAAPDLRRINLETSITKSDDY